MLPVTVRRCSSQGRSSVLAVVATVAAVEAGAEEHVVHLDVIDEPVPGEEHGANAQAVVST
jgi:hypothetical protein